MPLAINNLLLIALVIVLLNTSCTQAGVLLSVIPQSRNISAGTLVELVCATEESGVTTFGMTTTPELEHAGNSVRLNLPNGGRQHNLSFIALSKHSSITVTCGAVRFPDVNETTAVLMIQGPPSGVGNLTSSEVDHCTLNLTITWTAPYTLQGVPINYYTINITRHSDGAVLRSDTTNTTEYLYTVSSLSLGETLEVVVVAALNDAVTGNVSSIITQVGNSSFLFLIDERIRSGDGWTFKSTIEPGAICDDYRNATVHLHDETSGEMHNTAANITDGRRLVVYFNNLSEDKHYQATVKVHYHQIIQHSIPAKTNTFDVLHINHTILPALGAIQVNVDYVEGSVHNRFCTKLQCPSKNISDTFNGSSGIIDGVPPNELCTLLITDANAMSFIDTRAAVTIENIAVPRPTEMPTTNSPSHNTTMNQPTPNEGTNQGSVYIIVGVPIALVLATAILVIMTIYLVRAIKKKQSSRKTESNPVTQSQNFVPISPKMAEQPTLADAAESEIPPCVPPHTADSKKMYPSKTNHTENEITGPIYQQPSEENNPSPLPPRREEATDPNEQLQYADLAIRIQTSRETIPQQPPDAGLHTVYSTINHTAP